MKLEYKDWLKTQEKYKGSKCFVMGCDKEGLYEGGDVRYYCGMCEEHASMKKKYQWYLNGETRDPVIAGTW